MSFGECVFLLGCLTRVELLGHRVYMNSSLVDIAKMLVFSNQFSKMVLQIYIPSLTVLVIYVCVYKILMETRNVLYAKSRILSVLL